ncbi:MAG TPA: hypothetical protein DCQ06_10740, partial [Myxococcales bacterium]|nr:hypothetical protein [Myxococcales bacterium]HAN32063.1 hypothetical protein [Myxococcales bacterium]
MLPLPGPRKLWWLLSALGICLPLTLIWGGKTTSEKSRTEALQLSLRTRNAIWRMTDLVAGDFAQLPSKSTATEKLVAERKAVAL